MSISDWFSSWFRKSERTDFVVSAQKGVSHQGSSPPLEVAENSKSVAPPQSNPAREDTRDDLSPGQQVYWDYAVRLMQILNESLQISHNSTNPDTKVSRLELARSKLDVLIGLGAGHPYIKLENIEAVRKTLSDLTDEYTNAGYYAQAGKDRISYQQDVWRQWAVPMTDITKGWRFYATMQMRTPLRILTRHMEYHEGLTDPPSIARVRWEGWWLPVLKTFKEQGIDIPEFPEGHTASSVGPIPSSGGEFLKFLLAVRVIVESEQPIEARRIALKDELKSSRWGDFVQKLGGTQALTDQMFPAFINTIRGLPATAVATLWDVELTTPAQLSAASDDLLKAIKGIGPAKLKQIRKACAESGSPDCEFVDRVEK